MGARSMYETIMDLPLFKGVSADHVSSFLEKTSIEFHSYSSGETILNRGEEVKKLKFLISGTVKVSYELPGGEGKLTSLSDTNDVFGITRLFGIAPYYDSTVSAASDVSVMEFGKEKFLRMLASDSIYLMNYANLISHHSQNLIDRIRTFHRTGFPRLLAEWVVLFSTRRSFDIRIEGISALEKDLGRDYVHSGIERLADHGIVRIDGDVLQLADRELFLSYVCLDED